MGKLYSCRRILNSRTHFSFGSENFPLDIFVCPHLTACVRCTYICMHACICIYEYLQILFYFSYEYVCIFFLFFLHFSVTVRNFLRTLCIAAHLLTHTCSLSFLHPHARTYICIHTRKFLVLPELSQRNFDTQPHASFSP